MCIQDPMQRCRYLFCEGKSAREYERQATWEDVFVSVRTAADRGSCKCLGSESFAALSRSSAQGLYDTLTLTLDCVYALGLLGHNLDRTG